MNFKKIYEENRLREGKRKTKIMYQFKKGFDALNDAFSQVDKFKESKLGKYASMMQGIM